MSIFQPPAEPGERLDTAHDTSLHQLLFLVGQIDGKLGQIVKNTADHDTRIAALEEWPQRFAALAAAGGVAGAVLGYVGFDRLLAIFKS